MIRRILLATLILTLSAGACRAGEDAKSAWSRWAHMPVFGEGRVVPLDTFARETVEAICGRADPTLQSPDGGSRKFTAAELLFSWLAEPEKWEDVSFLAVPDQQLREDVLRLREQDGGKYISPAAVENCAELSRRLAELDKQADAEGKNFRPTGLDKKIKNLVDAYTKFRMLTFRPAASQQEAPQRFYTRLRLAANAWRKLAGDLQGAQRISHDDDTRRLMVESSEALQQLLKQIHGGEFSLDKIEPSVVAFSAASDQLAARLTDSDQPLNALAAELRHQAAQMHMALYDNGETVYLVPALGVGALEMNRDPSDDAKPWLSFQALIYGSPDLLGPYPQAELQEVRKAWDAAKTAYGKLGAKDPTTSAAIGRFVAAVRALGRQIEPLREKLPIRHRDQELIAATAYPPLGATDVEVFYNRLDPFFWSWVVSLAATLCLLFAVGSLRKPLFWLGVIVLAAAQVLTLVGLALRGYVTGLVPLTGMFETVVFVALSVAIFGLWFTLLPLFWPGLQMAWRMNEKAEGGGRRAEEGEGIVGAAGELPLRLGTRVVHGLLLRMGLTVLVFLALARWPGWFGLRIFDLWPPTALGTTVPSANDLLIWLAGLCVLAAIIYFLPRAILTLAIGAFTVPSLLARRQGDAMEQTFGRRLFILAGAIVSFVAMVLAYYAPASVMHRNLGSVTPILRDNYWLAVHVVTIMASYASAAIALILGNIALGYYLFGRYLPQTPAASQTAGHRPPEACAVLAGFTYTAIQITVLLLTAGTILGALWADKSWGRFWGWDPKEAWALISLLVYLVILHARYVGWSGNFGMAVAAVFGFTAVLFTWYGVNFFWGSGMHSYGAGAGGQWQVISAVAINWLLLVAAAVRYGIENEGRGAGDEGRGIRDER